MYYPELFERNAGTLQVIDFELYRFKRGESPVLYQRIAVTSASPEMQCHIALLPTIPWKLQITGDEKSRISVLRILHVHLCSKRVHYLTSACLLSWS